MKVRVFRRISFYSDSDAELEVSAANIGEAIAAVEKKLAAREIAFPETKIERQFACYGMATIGAGGEDEEEFEIEHVD